MRFWFSPILILGVLFKILAQQEANYIDSLDFEIKRVQNAELAWGNRFSALDSIENRIISRYGKISASWAFLTHKRGVFYYYEGLEGNQESFNSAVEFLLMAIEVRKTVMKENADLALDIVKGYSNVGTCLLKLNQPYKALDYLLLGLDLSSSTEDYSLPTRTLLNLHTNVARTFRRVGDYDNSILHYQSIVGVVNSQTDADLRMKTFKVRAYIEMAFIQAYYLDLGNVAITNLKWAEKELVDNEYRRRDILLANAYNNLGLAYKANRDIEKAQHYFKLSIRKNLQIKNQLGLGYNYLNLGILFFDDNQIDSSEYYLVRGDSLVLSQSDTTQRFLFFDNLGDVKFAKGEYASSLDYDNLALKQLVPSFRSTQVYSLPRLSNEILFDKVTTLISIESKASTFLYLFDLRRKPIDLHAAYQHFKAADQVIAMMRSEFVADASKVSLVDRTKAIYEKAIEACWELYQLNPADSTLRQAFEYAEKSKSIILQDAVRRTRAKSVVRQDLIEDEKQFNLRVNYYEKQVALSRSNPSSDINYLDSLLLYRRKRDAVVATIREEFPGYHYSIFEQATSSPKQVQELLKPDGGFIEYFVGDSSIFTFAITEDTILFLRDKIDFDKEEWGKTFSATIGELNSSFLRSSYRMYGKLIQPITEYIKLPTKLTIVPDGVISTIAFDALVTVKPPSERIYFPDFKDYLIYDHQISYAFSATTLIEAPNKANSSADSFLGVAPGFEEGFNIGETYFQKLDWNDLEVQEAGGLFGNARILSDNLSSDKLFDQASDYDILHFATHAKADHSDGNLSYILLGSTKRERLYVNDLYAMDLNANMTVLSACQTGVGPIYRGEGVISLARGFTYAGSASVITSLWNVREETNNAIILKFYSGLERGLSKDEALREAKLTFLESVTRDNQEKAHPYYWAPLISIGDMSPYDQSSSLRWGILAAVVLGVLSIAYLRRRQRTA